jgi:hypothetical protein
LEILDIVAIVLIAIPLALLGYCMMEARRGSISGTLVYFSFSLFVSASLLFMVQPMIGKMILPRLGGTPQVWNTCVMFFQTVLLLGYGYTHNLTNKLPLGRQLVIHSGLLILPIIVLLMFGRPFYIGTFGAEGGGNPIFMTLGLLAMIVGIPFLIVSTTSPLLQRWFNFTGDKASADPYFLSAASNAGSMLGLLLYPVLIERYLGLEAQAWMWLFVYVGLALLVAGCAYIVSKAPPAVQLAGAALAPEPPPPELPVPVEPGPKPPETAVTATPPASAARSTAIRRGGKRGRHRGPSPAIKTPALGGTIQKRVAEPQYEPRKPFEMTPLRRLRWVGLAAVPSSLMLGVTTYMSTDISAIPFFWVLPLSLYLLSFILVFLRWPVPWTGTGRIGETTPHKVMLVAQLVCVPLLMLIILMSAVSPIWRSTLACLLGFFTTACVCHGELARDRPPTKYLTEFYLWMSVGGMIGGTFNALIAPAIPWFGLFEFPLALVFAALVRPPGQGPTWTEQFFGEIPEDTKKSLSLVLDFVLAAVLFAVAWMLLAKCIGDWNWSYVFDPQRVEKALDRNMQNPLFRWVHKSLGFSSDTAYSLTEFLWKAVVYWIPLILAVLTYKRPTRLALCFAAVFLANSMYNRDTETPFEKTTTLVRDRSYFGILKVIQDSRWTELANGDRFHVWDYTYLMHGTTHHGLNYLHYALPARKDASGKEIPARDLTLPMNRLATTYYHRDGPLGAVMEKLNWFPGCQLEKNSKLLGPDESQDSQLITFWADARMPMSLVGAGAPTLGVTLPLTQIVDAWSEPAYATIGLGTGTMASYGRPFHHVTFYEIDQHIRRFSLPPPDQRVFFTYLQGCLKRGCKLEVIMGDARLTMTLENEQRDATYVCAHFPIADPKDVLSTVPISTSTSFRHRQAYYRAIEVDAFSSDAIPVHLITKEAIEMYMSRLSQGKEVEVEEPDPKDSTKTIKTKQWMNGGVLCVHTSNRHVNLVQPVIRICQVAEWDFWGQDAEGHWNGITEKRVGLKWVIGKDEGDRAAGHFGSEYILVARDERDLPPGNLTLTPRQMELDKEYGIQPVYHDEKQLNLYKAAGLNPVKTSIEWMGPHSRSKYMEAYRYLPPPRARVWTDDYSNVLSVFRWN